MVLGSLFATPPVHANHLLRRTSYFTNPLALTTLHQIASRFGPVWFAASHLHDDNLPAVCTSIAILTVLLLRRFWPNPSNMIVLIFNIVLAILLSLTILPFFYAVGPAVRANHRHTYDEYLLAFDNHIWGGYVALPCWNSPLRTLRARSLLLAQPAEAGKFSAALLCFCAFVLTLWVVLLEIIFVNLSACTQKGSWHCF